MSRSRHSSSEYFGGSKMWSDSSSLSWPVKSSIGEMSERTSATPCSRNHRKDSRCTAIRSGSCRTSCNLEKERRSRVAREAKVAPEGSEGRKQASCDRAAGAREPWERTQRRHGRADTTVEQSRTRIVPVQDRKGQTRTGLRAGGRIRRSARQVKVSSEV